MHDQNRQFCCPNCGWKPKADPAAEIARMKAWCLANGHHVSWDDHVDKVAAAALLGVHPGTLDNWATVAAGPPYRQRGGKGKAPRGYALADLVAFRDG